MINFVSKLICLLFKSQSNVSPEHNPIQFSRTASKISKLECGLSLTAVHHVSCQVRAFTKCKIVFETSRSWAVRV